MSTLADSDHFLGAVEPVIDHALTWVESMLGNRGGTRG